MDFYIFIFLGLVIIYYFIQVKKYRNTSAESTFTPMPLHPDLENPEILSGGQMGMYLSQEPFSYLSLEIEEYFKDDESQKIALEGLLNEIQTFHKYLLTISPDEEVEVTEKLVNSMRSNLGLPLKN